MAKKITEKNLSVDIQEQLISQVEDNKYLCNMNISIKKMKVLNHTIKTFHE